MSDRTHRKPMETAREPHPFDIEPVPSEKSRLIRVPDPDEILTVAIKRYAGGKCFLSTVTRSLFEPEVTRALEQTARLRITFDRSAFIARLKASGLGEQDVCRALESLRYADETFLADRCSS